MSFHRFFLVCALTVTNAVQAADEGDTKRGTIVGRFLFEGKAPVAERLTLNKDLAYCGKHKPVDESLIVDAKTGGIQNVVIWLDAKSSGRKPELPAKNSDRKPAVRRMDNFKCRFEPHVCVARVGEPLLLGNKDPIAHAMQIYFFMNDPHNLTIEGKGKDVKITPEYSEPIPSKVICPLHPWMQGWIVVQDHPFVAVTDKTGKFTVENLPVGDWTFRIWQESAGYLESGTIDGEAAKWKRGRIELTIDAGQQDIGEIRLSPELFKSDDS